MNVTYGYQASVGQMGAGSSAGNAGQLVTTNGTINGTTESASFRYDLLGRLTSASQASNGSSAQRTFAYDRWGNRTAAYDDNMGIHQIQSIQLEQSGGAPTNRITSITSSGSTVNYTYDAAGNVTNDGLHSYTYDAENRLASADGGATAQYRYDHQNRRVTKIVGSSWTHYIWAGSRIISEHDGTTAYSTNPPYQVLSARLDYIYAGGRMIQSRQRASSTGSWLAQYYLSDRLSARVTLDRSGNVLGRQAHLPFGEDFASSATQEKHHFTSYQRDAETSSDYAINRNLANTIGRFLRADPYKASGFMVDPQSWNRYSYTRNNPTNRVDPLGLGDEPPDDDDEETHYEPPTFFGFDMGVGDGLNGEMARVDDVMRDLGIGADPQAPLPDAPLLIDLVIAALDAMLGKKECADFVQALITQAAKDTKNPFYSTNPAAIFAVVNGPQGGGTILRQSSDNGIPIGGTIQGSIGNIGFPNATPPAVIISPTQYAGSDFNLRAAQNVYAFVALHETIHLAAGSGFYSDRDMATAIRNLGGLSEDETAKYNSINRDDDLGYSRFWNGYLQKHCFP